MTALRLALFDLDHTLIPFDSGMAWTQFLVAKGVLGAKAEAVYLGFCHQYVAGTLDIHAMHRASLAPLLHVPRPVLAQWTQAFEADVAQRIPEAMQALVARHRDAGDLCALVTATTRFIAEPFARLFGIADVLATEAATVDGSAQAAFTGEIAGAPCFRQHKLSRVADWLAQRQLQLASFERSWFYSDSISDLPLLLAVTDPVAVRPDAGLRAHALRAGWPIE